MCQGPIWNRFSAATKTALLSLTYCFGVAFLFCVLQISPAGLPLPTGKISLGILGWPSTTTVTIKKPGNNDRLTISLSKPRRDAFRCQCKQHRGRNYAQQEMSKANTMQHFSSCICNHFACVGLSCISSVFGNGKNDQQECVFKCCA